MERFRVGIVVPAFNEASTIAEIVRQAREYGICIVVDDASSDRTAFLASQAGAIVVNHSLNMGYDAALNSGFAKADELSCDVVMTIDADGQHDPSLIQVFLGHVAAGAGLVLGVRDKKQRVAETIFGWYSNARFGIADPLCGLKAYRIEIYRDLGCFDSYRSVGTQLMLFAVSAGYPVSTVRFLTREREGRPRFGSRCSGNYRIIRALLISICRSIGRRSVS